MFNESDYQLITENYFNIYELSESLIYLESKNTYHSWKLIPIDDTILIKHKHFSSCWHNHKKVHTIHQALGEIKSHDKYVINRIHNSFYDYNENPAEQYFYF